ncbi:MAG: sulfatase [Spirosomaceae bacterium]|nr:sulfatase [Spirosomataceae bacterium]
MKKPLLLLLSVILLSANAPQKPTTPNVVLFFIDDMGAVDLGCYGNVFNQTPNIDKLAKRGVKFTNAYSACTVCSPSRAALMTGKYPAQLHLTDWIAGHVKKNPKLNIPDWRMYLPQEEKTIAEHLHEKGYSTWHVGKWHLGEGDTYLPTNQGFDLNIGGSNWGQPKGSYFSPFKMPHLQDDDSKGYYLTDRLTDEAVKLIENQDTHKPFFLNFWHYGVHTPLQARADKIEKYKQLLKEKDPQKNPVYAAMIESVDESVARVMATLEKKNMLENTLVVFAADNGTLMTTATSHPFRKGKGWSYEGGTRTPLLVYWKGHFENGLEVHSPAITMDISATILKAVGLAIPKTLHGNDLNAIVSKKKMEERPLFWHYPHYHEGNNPYGAVRKGDWKLIEFYESGALELYNLKNDIGETQNLASTEPAKTKELANLLNNWRTKMKAQMPTPNPDFKP